jgi:uncharacterized membrane protein YqaE (UPF0057 family)
MNIENVNQPWYKKKLWIVVLCFIFPPIGVFLLWKYGAFNKNVNYVLTFIGIVFFISVLVTKKGGNEENSTEITKDKNIPQKVVDENSSSKYGLEKSSLSKEVIIINAQEQIKFERERDRLNKLYKVDSKEEDKIFDKTVLFTSSYFKDKNDRIENWHGIIKFIDNSKNISLEILSDFHSFEIIYWASNYSNPELLKSINGLKVGDAVIFSGYVIQDGKKGIKERSITDNGYMYNPEFQVNFVDIQKNEFPVYTRSEILTLPADLQNMAINSKTLLKSEKWNNNILDVLEGKLIGKDEFEKQDYKVNVLPNLQKDLFKSTFWFSIDGPLKEVETTLTDFKYVFNLDKYNFEKQIFNLFVVSDELIKLEVDYNVTLPHNFDISKDGQFTIKIPSSKAKEWKLRSLEGAMSLDIFLTFKKRPSEYPNKEYELKGTIVNAVLTNISTGEVYWKMK